MSRTRLAEPDADGDEARATRPLRAAAVTRRIAFGPRRAEDPGPRGGSMRREEAARPPGRCEVEAALGGVVSQRMV